MPRICLRRILELIKVRVDVIVFKIRVVNQISKSPPNSKIGFIVKKTKHIVDKYDVSNGKVRYINGWMIETRAV